MNILVSGCLMGDNCKYDGGNNFNGEVKKLSEKHNIVKICPEILSGMGSPRKKAEIKDGVVFSIDGKNVDKFFKDGVERALINIEGKEIDLAILQSRSPSCGVNNIYDGTFGGKLVKGQGVFAKALMERGISVIDVEDIQLCGSLFT